MNNVKTIEEVLRTEGMFISTTSGFSMYPMLRDRKDTVVIVPPNRRLQKGEVVLYKANDTYVLHRILEVLPDSYIIRGDNCDEKEYGITDEQIIGVLIEFYRGDRKIDMEGRSYNIYCTYLFIWRMYRRVKRSAGKVWRAITRRGSN